MSILDVDRYSDTRTAILVETAANLTPLEERIFNGSIRSAASESRRMLRTSLWFWEVRMRPGLLDRATSWIGGIRRGKDVGPSSGFIQASAVYDMIYHGRFYIVSDSHMQGLNVNYWYSSMRTSYIEVWLYPSMITLRISLKIRCFQIHSGIPSNAVS